MEKKLQCHRNFLKSSYERYNMKIIASSPSGAISASKVDCNACSKSPVSCILFHSARL
uniref:Uncharacterized protein n=1 Tax=Arion vulgaris TaxID=1028688 RepID=A0A0B6Z358_9EUPU